MAAGQGFKTFTSGDVLTAADVNGYLMQGVGVFADATERDAEITSPEEGQFAYLKDTNVTTYYTGSAWANLDTTGMLNPMTTTGDTIYSSSGSTPARLGIGTAGQILQVNSGATAPEWATPTSGGMTLIATATPSGASSVSFTSIPTLYKQLQVQFLQVFASTETQLRFRINNNTGNVYSFNGSRITGNAVAEDSNNLQVFYFSGGKIGNSNTDERIKTFGKIDFFRASSSEPHQIGVLTSGYSNGNFRYETWINNGVYTGTNAPITQLDLSPDSGTFTGTFFLYGLS